MNLHSEWKYNYSIETVMEQLVDVIGWELRNFP